jgi:hypothetical protein
MKIKELIEKLSAFPPEMEASIYEEEKDTGRENPFVPVELVQAYADKPRAESEGFPNCVVIS